MCHLARREGGRVSSLPHEGKCQRFRNGNIEVPWDLPPREVGFIPNETGVSLKTY